MLWFDGFLMLQESNKWWKWEDWWKNCERCETLKASEDGGYRYAHFSIHHEMLSDSTRTEAYRNAIYNNPHQMSCMKESVLIEPSV